MGFLLKLLACSAGLAAAAWLLDGIEFIGPSGGENELEQKVLPLLGVALILTLVNTFILPLLKVISFPILVLTLGLFFVVINAAMLMLTAAIAEGVGLNFHVENFLSAVLGSVIITIVTWSVDMAFGDK